jgi:hypothetical protein
LSFGFGLAEKEKAQAEACATKKKRLAGSEAQYWTGALYLNDNTDQIKKSGADRKSKTAALKPKAAAPHLPCAPPASSTSPASAFIKN